MNNFGMRYGFFVHSLSTFSQHHAVSVFAGLYSRHLSGSIPSGHPN